MVKVFTLLMILITLNETASAQNIGIGTSTPHASAVLEIKSNTRGILLPRTSTTSRNAIAGPAKGLILYDTTTSTFWFHNGSAWSQLASGGNGWNITGNAGINATNNFIGTSDNQPLRFRVNNIWGGEIHPTTGNVFVGLSSGNSSTTGQSNSAFGDHSLAMLTDGNFNAAAGYYSLSVNTAGYNNAGFGAYALYNNTTGFSNTGLGRNALFANTTGTYNTAVGTNALLSATGSFNTATGYNALTTTTIGIFNTSSGYKSLEANTTGNYNTAIGANALNISSTGDFNTATGSQALRLNTSGMNNTATGARSLLNNSTGINNTANGFESLLTNSTGKENTATGFQALYFNTTGNSNTANGYAALGINSTGSNNTADGYYALFSNTTGGQNTASGDHALYGNSSGLGNTAQGAYALSSNSIGGSNTAVGSFANNSNTTGDANTSMGQAALSSNTTGYQNTAIGSGALFNNVSGHNNIAIGANSGTGGANAANLFNTIGIGNDGGFLNGASNQAIIGNASTIFIGGKVTWQTVSDARIKNNVTEDVKGLDFILRLRPVMYNVSNKAIADITGNKETADFPGKYDGEKIKYTGFLAQEVEQAAKAANYNFSGYTVPKTEHGLYTLSYEQFVVPLVKAMQEQQQIIRELRNDNDELRKRLDRLEKMISSK